MAANRPAPANRGIRSVPDSIGERLERNDSPKEGIVIL